MPHPLPATYYPSRLVHPLTAIQSSVKVPNAHNKFLIQSERGGGGGGAGVGAGAGGNDGRLRAELHNWRCWLATDGDVRPNVVDKMTLSRKLQNIKFLVPAPVSSPSSRPPSAIMLSCCHGANHMHFRLPRFDFCPRTQRKIHYKNI